MANKEHLAILKKGVEAWNRWREENPRLAEQGRFAETKRSIKLPLQSTQKATLLKSDVRC